MTAHVAGKKKGILSVLVGGEVLAVVHAGLVVYDVVLSCTTKTFSHHVAFFFLFPFRCNKLCYEEVINEHGWTFRKYSVVLSQRGTMSMTLTRWWRNAVKHHILICITLRTKILTRKLKWNAMHKANLTDCIITPIPDLVRALRPPWANHNDDGIEDVAN